MVIQLEKLILIFIRITAFIVICPGISFKGISNIFKIGLSISLALLVYTLTPDFEALNNIFLFFLISFKEAILGLSLGFITNLIFSTAEMAGKFVDFQVGFSMASVYDPSIGGTASNYGKIYYWISISVFFLLDMHHKVIQSVIKSFDYIPIAEAKFNGFQINAVIRLFAELFEIALNLAAPVIIVVLVTDIVLGVISKTVPQINVLMLGMPLKSMVSFFISMLTISWLLNYMGNIIHMIPENLHGFMNLFR